MDSAQRDPPLSDYLHIPAYPLGDDTGVYLQPLETRNTSLSCAFPSGTGPEPCSTGDSPARHGTARLNTVRLDTARPAVPRH